MCIKKVINKVKETVNEVYENLKKPVEMNQGMLLAELIFATIVTGAITERRIRRETLDGVNRCLSNIGMNFRIRYTSR